MKKIRLVNTEGSHNKFYIMEQLSPNSWRASYGRIERPGSAQHTTYHMELWSDKYHEKLKKGYRLEEEVALDFDSIMAALDQLEAQMKAKEGA